MKDVELLEVAEKELDEAIEYYNKEQPEVRDEFLLEFLRTLDRIREFPQSAEPFTETTRRALTRRFPYGIIYENREEHVEVMAIAHLHRDPAQWEDRLDE